jgi:hypothetical protein
MRPFILIPLALPDNESSIYRLIPLKWFEIGPFAPSI